MGTAHASAQLRDLAARRANRHGCPRHRDWMYSDRHPAAVGWGPVLHRAQRSGTGRILRVERRRVVLVRLTVPPARAGEQAADSTYETSLLCFSSGADAIGPSFTITGPIYTSLPHRPRPVRR